MSWCNVFQTFSRRDVRIWSIFDDVWSQVSVILIPNLHNPTFVSDFRPITLIGTLCKLYFRCIAQHVRSLEQGQICEAIFAYRQGYQAAEEVFAVRQLIEKCNEWDVPLYFGKADIFKAYDRIKISSILSALQSYGVEDLVIHRIVRECISSRSIFAYGKARSDPIHRSRGMPQGDPLSPWFSTLLWVTLLRVYSSLIRDYGLVYFWNAASALAVTVFQFWLLQTISLLLASTRVELQVMFDMLSLALLQLGLSVDSLKCEWSHNICVHIDKQWKPWKSMKINENDKNTFCLIHNSKTM